MYLLLYFYGFLYEFQSDHCTNTGLGSLNRAGATYFRLVRQSRCEQARGVWGHAPPGKFLKLGTLRSLLRPCLGQNATRIFPPVVAVAREAIEPSCQK